MNACRESAKTTERILAAMLLMFVALLVSCGGKTADLTGNWVQSNSNSKTSAMIAVIADEEIAVYWYNASNKVSALYWAGTYKKPSSAGD